MPLTLNTNNLFSKGSGSAVAFDPDKFLTLHNCLFYIQTQDIVLGSEDFRNK